MPFFFTLISFRGLLAKLSCPAVLYGLGEPHWWSANISSYPESNMGSLKRTLTLSTKEHNITWDHGFWRSLRMFSFFSFIFIYLLPAAFRKGGDAWLKQSFKNLKLWLQNISQKSWYLKTHTWKGTLIWFDKCCMSNDE